MVIVSMAFSGSGCVAGGGTGPKGSDDTGGLADFAAPDTGLPRSDDAGGPDDAVPPADDILKDSGTEDALPDTGPAGPTCEAFCTDYMSTCGDVALTGVLPAYVDMAQCVAICGAAAWPKGTLDDVAMNTIGCRIRSLQEDGAASGCKAGAPDGGGYCGSPCKNFCTLALSHCTGEELVYSSQGECLGYCASMNDDGAPGVALGDTVQCRMQLLLDLALDPFALPQDTCPHVGAEASGSCGLAPNCTAYCDAVMSACPTDGDASQYPSVEICQDYCTDYAQFSPGVFSSDNSYSLGCRMVAASKATFAPGTFCPAAGPAGDGACGAPCDIYCHLASSVCGDLAALFPDVETCLETCPEMSDLGTLGDASGDTVQCRATLLFKAALGLGDKATACGQAAVDAQEVCFTPPEPPTCEAYCSDVMAACGPTNAALAQYASAASCLAFCAHEELLPAGLADASEGNTRSCRATHAQLALSAPEAADFYCPVAGPTGANICGVLTENYCQVAIAQCPGEGAIYTSLEHCLSVAAEVPEVTPPGVEGDFDLTCMFGELITGLATNQPGFKCSEGSFWSGTCVGVVNSSSYCNMVAAGCGGDDYPFDNALACIDFSVKQAFPAGTMGDTSGATLGCRFVQAKEALYNGTKANCDAAGGDGGGVCGSLCEVYCGLGTALCEGVDGFFADQAMCLEACATLPLGQGLDPWYGNSVTCRVSHLNAGFNGLDLATACSEGAFGGGLQCAEGVLPPPKTYVEHVQPILAARCTPCHGVGEPEAGSCSGSACFATLYSELTEPSYYCPGKTKGACAVERIKDGSMPLLGEGPSDDELTILETWLLDGMLEN